MKISIKNTEKILSIAATILPCVIFSIIMLSMCFMYEQIAAHFNIAGEVNRWGSKYELFGLAFAYYLLPLIFAVIFCKVKMASSTRIIGLSASIAMSLAFIGVTIFLIIRIFNNSIEVILNVKERVALIVTILGCIMFTITHLCPFVDKQKIKNVYIRKYPKLTLAGLWIITLGITVGSVIINNYYSFLLLFVMLAIAVAVYFVAVAIICKMHPELAKVKVAKEDKPVLDTATENTDIGGNIEGNTAKENAEISEDSAVTQESIESSADNSAVVSESVATNNSDEISQENVITTSSSKVAQEVVTQDNIATENVVTNNVINEKVADINKEINSTDNIEDKSKDKEIKSDDIVGDSDKTNSKTNKAKKSKPKTAKQVDDKNLNNNDTL